MRKPVRRVIALVAIVAAALLIAGLVYRGRASSDMEYVTVPATNGSIRTVVNATGTVQPVVTVQVGAQISGQVKEIYADFNTIVKHGQLLARIDPRNFEAQMTNAQAKVEAARSSVSNAQAQKDTAAADVSSAKAGLNEAQVARNNTTILYKRAQDLSEQGLISKNDLDTARTNDETAAAKVEQAKAAIEQTQAKQTGSAAQIQQMRAQLTQAEADLKQAQVNLGFTDIVSPVDGVVIARNVDVGQTIAASLQSPTLFTIANDLTRMQVNASIDEADIGNISSSSQARFMVDAFPNEYFNGRIHEIRLNPTTVQNVVTYNAILDIDNPDLRLKPGMTANINITVDQRDNVLKIPNGALRYAPAGATPEQIRTLPSTAMDTTPAQSSPSRLVEGESPKAPGQKWDPQDKIQLDRPRERVLRSAKIWVLNAEKNPESRAVTLGITDGSVTEIVSGSLKPGDAVIVGDTSQVSTQPRPQNRTMNPFLPPPRGGNRGR